MLGSIQELAATHLPSWVSSAIGGVVAALLVATLFRHRERRRQERLRREQIAYVRDLIIDTFGRMDNIALTGAEGSGLNQDHERRRFYDALVSEMESALVNRCADIDYHDRHELRRRIQSHVDEYNRLLRLDNPPQGSSFYDGLYVDLQDLEWLTLPERKHSDRK